MPTEVIGKLKNKERPKKSERLEMIRLIVSEILIVCPTPGKRHLCEIARKMVVTYPSSFKDVIEGEIVGSGYDSLTKQLMSKVDNCKRGNTPLALKRRALNTRVGEAPKRMRLDSYGCVNWLPDKLPPSETNESQKHTQEELKNMYADKSNDARSIEKKMAATFYTQRRKTS
ncbi:hypothetical protein SKAU_G00411720 [Synaphobranchus kaupii]|uniref:Uncharacterized protein n=1 Tax=Synaphobranchus kaupii TaxID=118154 RepID=A0A9Q1I9V4_SYNKA|nr:hypothetical protein SKAU_G00411720 [Synaphobranchus kaupii]